MKKAKVLLTLVCAVLLVAASVMGTMAYLTSKSSVTNTFTVGKVELGGGDYEDGLDEALVNENGQPINNDTEKKVVELAEAPRVTENDYKLKPGHEYTKDPTIHVAKGSEDCYLFVKVENGISAIEDGSNTIASQMKANGWAELDATKYPGVYVYVGTAEGASAPLLVSTTATADTSVPVFEKFKIAGTVVAETLDKYTSAEIVVTAYAVQADGFESFTAVAIWEAAFVPSTAA